MCLYNMTKKVQKCCVKTINIKAFIKLPFTILLFCKLNKCEGPLEVKYSLLTLLMASYSQPHRKQSLAENWERG